MGSDLLELAGIAAAAFGIGLSGAVMPGPVTSVTLANVGRSGVMAGPLVTLGHAIVEGALVLALAFGAGNFLSLSWVTGTIAVLGAGVLAWMGWGMVSEARKGDVDAGGSSGGSRIPPPVAGGALASLANPYWYLWWATVGFSSVAVVQAWGGLGIASFFTGHIMADFVWLTALSFTLSKGRRLMTPKVYRGLVAALGLFLLVFSCLFFAFGVGKLVRG